MKASFSESKILCLEGSGCHKPLLDKRFDRDGGSGYHSGQDRGSGGGPVALRGMGLSFGSIQDRIFFSHHYEKLGRQDPRDGGAGGPPLVGISGGGMEGP